MPRVFKAKVRKVGASLVILVPKELAEKEGIKEGEEVQIGLLKPRKLQDVLKLMGSAKGARALERDRDDETELFRL